MQQFFKNILERSYKSIESHNGIVHKSLFVLPRVDLGGNGSLGQTTPRIRNGRTPNHKEPKITLGYVSYTVIGTVM